MGDWPAGISVIIPAHNEAASLPRLLAALNPSGPSPNVEIIVVANACVDRTVEVARSVAGVVVVEIAEASKRAALAEGNLRARHAHRAYVDADVLLTGEDLRRLLAAVQVPGVLAAAPERRLVRAQVGRLVRWYYDVWEQLPQVRSGLFGRGVIVLSADGVHRISTLPAMMSDDLLMSEAFTAAERRVVPEAKVSIWPPRSLADLIRRRVRVATGNAEMDQQGMRGPEASTSVRTLLTLLRDRPRLLAKVAVFVGVTLVARARSRRWVRKGDFQTWLRDESSRRT